MIAAGAKTAVDNRSGLNHDVLVLNQNLEPLNVTNARRAVTLIMLEKAEPLETNGMVFRSARATIPGPSVVRLLDFVKRPQPELKLTRSSVFARDDSTCQYCGARGPNLTLDHVVPRARGGEHEWGNLVTCCLRCNNLKGNQTPQEAGMRLLRRPRRPRYTPYISLSTFMAAYRSKRWVQYLEPFVEYAEFAEP